MSQSTAATAGGFGRRKEPKGVTTATVTTKSGKSIQVKQFPKLTNGQINYATVIAFIAWTISTFDFVLEGTLLPVMSAEFGWSTAYSAQVSMYVSIAVLIVSFTVGPVAEKVGRSNALLLCTLGTCLASFLTGFTQGVVMLVIFRAISAYGYQEQCVNATYMNEITVEVKNKGFRYGFVQGGWPIGVMVGAVICTLFLDSLGWRGVYWLATAPAIVIIILRMRLAESPRYYEMQEVKKLLKEGRREDAIELGDVYGIDVVKMTEKNTIGQLFEPGFRVHTIALFAVNILIWFPCQVFSVLGTTVLTSAKGLEFHNALAMTIAVNAFAYIGYLVAGKVGDKLGRKKVIIVIWIISGISFLSCMLFAHGQAAVLITYMIGTFCMLGGWATLMTYQGESYPTRVRAFAVSTQNAVGYVGAIIASGIFAAAITAWGTAIGAVVAGAIPMVVAGLVMILAHSIKPGQKLEDIAQ